jgi:hypothetical protein
VNASKNFRDVPVVANTSGHSANNGQGASERTTAVTPLLLACLHLHHRHVGDRHRHAGLTDRLIRSLVIRAHLPAGFNH